MYGYKAIKYVTIILNYTKQKKKTLIHFLKPLNLLNHVGLLEGKKGRSKKVYASIIIHYSNLKVTIILTANDTIDCLSVRERHTKLKLKSPCIFGHKPSLFSLI